MAVDAISVVTGLRILGFGDVCTSGYVNEFCPLGEELVVIRILCLNGFGNDTGILVLEYSVPILDFHSDFVTGRRGRAFPPWAWAANSISGTDLLFHLNLSKKSFKFLIPNLSRSISNVKNHFSFQIYFFNYK